MPSRLVPAVTDLLMKLVDGSLVRSPGHPYLGRVKAEDAQRVLGSIVGTPTPVPAEAIRSADVMPVADSKPPRWAIDVNLWYDGERSDLTAIVEATLHPDGRVEVALDDLRVL